MINKLRQNYRLSMILACAIFLISFCFCHFYFANGLLAAIQIYFGTVILKSFLLTLLVVAIEGGIACLVLYGVIKLFFYFAKIYNLPAKEIFFLALLFASARHLLMGCFNLLYYFYPDMLGWGNIILPVVTALVSLILFSITINKLYLSAKAAPFFIKSFSLLSLALVLIVCFVCINGGTL